MNGLCWGTLEVRLKFDAKNNKMWVFVIKATLEMAHNASKQTLVQIHLALLPQKRLRYRTRIKPIDNAMFAEEFFCKVSPGSLIFAHVLTHPCLYQKRFTTRAFDFVCTRTSDSNARNCWQKRR